jgi:recombination protein RecA
MTDWRDDLESQFGSSIFRSGFGGDVLPSGSFVIDYLTGIGGYPLGSIVEIFGKEGSGKTTLALSAIYEALKKEMPVLYEDFESTVSDKYLKKLGINPDSMVDYRVFPESMEDGWMVMKRFCEKYKNGLMVVDSLAAMPPKFDIEKMKEVIGQTKVASAAAVMSIALKQMTKVVKERNMCLIFVNQERSKIDTFKAIAGSKTTPGGAAVRYFAGVRIKTRLNKPVKASQFDVLVGGKRDRVIAIEVGIYIDKNKFAPSYRHAPIYIRMDEGVDNLSSAIKVGEHLGFVEQKRGGRFYLDERYSGDTLGKHQEHGLENLRRYFATNPSEWQKFIKDIMNKLSEKLKNGG